MIKDLGTTLAISTNTVLNENFSGSSYPWIATNAGISYGTGQMHISGTPPVLQYTGVARTLDLMPGEIYRVKFDLKAISVGTSTMSFAFSGGSATQYGSYDYSQPMTSGLTTYTFYVTPNTVQSTFYINVTSPSSSFSWDIDNFIVEMSTASPKPLYTAVANDLTDYYAFGSPMPGRQYHASAPNAYRYGFNKGSENDKEVYGDGNLISTFYRELDTRLGRWWQVDPKQSMFESPYVSMANNPVIFNDQLGDIVKHHSLRDKFNTTFGRIFNKDFRKDYKQLAKSDQLYIYNGSKDFGKGTEIMGETTWDEKNNAVVLNYRFGKTPGLGSGRLGTIYHETTHGVQFDNGEFGFVKQGDTWWGANKEITDEYEAYDAEYMHGKSDYYTVNNGLGGKAKDRTNSKKWKDGSIEQRIGYTEDPTGHHPPVIKKVNANSVKIDNSNNHFRPYNPNSPNPNNFPIEKHDATVPVEVKPKNENGAFDWNSH